MITKEDAGKYIVIDLIAPELSLLRELLRFEYVIQVTAIENNKELADKVQSRVLKLIESFESYRAMDDYLLNLQYSMKSIAKSAAKNPATAGLPVKNSAVIYKATGKMCRLLLTTTVAGGLPDYLHELHQKYGPTLLSKLEDSIKNDYSIDRLNAEYNMKIKPPKQSVKQEKIENNGDFPPINMLGQKGIA